MIWSAFEWKWIDTMKIHEYIFLFFDFINFYTTIYKNTIQSNPILFSFFKEKKKEIIFRNHWIKFEKFLTIQKKSMTLNFFSHSKLQSFINDWENPSTLRITNPQKYRITQKRRLILKSSALRYSILTKFRLINLISDLRIVNIIRPLNNDGKLWRKSHDDRLFMMILSILITYLKNKISCNEWLKKWSAKAFQLSNWFFKIYSWWKDRIFLKMR